MSESPLRKLEQIGALQLLVHLLRNNQDKYVSRYIRRGNTEEGIASDRALLKARTNLKELGLLVEETQDELPFKTIMKLTDSGKIVAKKVLDILDILNASATS